MSIRNRPLLRLRAIPVRPAPSYPPKAVTVAVVPTIAENVCWEFNTMVGCPRGDWCQWKHEYVATAAQPPPQNKSAFAAAAGGNFGPLLGPGGNYNICWEFNTVVGCPRGAMCQWKHERVK